MILKGLPPDPAPMSAKAKEDWAPSRYFKQAPLVSFEKSPEEIKRSIFCLTFAFLLVGIVSAADKQDFTVSAPLQPAHGPIQNR